jgi:lysophospholipase L1-like esterase
MNARINRSIFYIVYLLISASLLILCVEGVGRLIIHFKYGVPGKSYGLWMYDKDLGATHRPNGYNTRTSLNNYGLRNREDVLDPKPENGLRIIAFGGSTTYGYNLTDKDTYTQRLQDRFRTEKNYEKTQVLNAGRIMYSAGHTLILMKRLVPLLKPDYVIIYEGINEYTNMLYLEWSGVDLDKENGHYGLIAKNYDQNRWLKRNSVIVRYLDYAGKEIMESEREKKYASQGERVFELPANELAPLHPWAIENYRYLMGQMLDFLRQEGVIPVVVRYACMQKDYHTTFGDISEQLAREKGVAVYDMRAKFDQFGEKKKDYFIYTGVHFTPEGAKIVADGLFDVIMQQEREKARSKAEVSAELGA